MCTPPNHHDNGYHFPSRSAFYVGETIGYTCGDAMVSEDWSILTCREDKTWDGTYPTSCRSYGMIFIVENILIMIISQMVKCMYHV